MRAKFLPYDIYERHRKVGSFIKDGQTVLDVGGELNHLSQFTTPKKIIVANLTGGDVIITKNHLPFTTNSFDVVCAIDVLEHIPKNRRSKFIKGLLRVSKKLVILSFPLGTSEHVKYEKKLKTWAKRHKIDIAYLNEHIRLGLPTLEDIGALTMNLQTTKFYSGNIPVSKYLFRLHLFDPQIRFIRITFYKLKLLFNFLTNPIFFSFLSSRKLSDNVNRAYIIIEK